MSERSSEPGKEEVEGRQGMSPLRVTVPGKGESRQRAVAGQKLACQDVWLHSYLISRKIETSAQEPRWVLEKGSSRDFLILNSHRTTQKKRSVAPGSRKRECPSDFLYEKVFASFLLKGRSMGPCFQV